ncbi:MAG: type I 3-dehydroquinate dehydratase [Chthoniobacteraceae bacterium]
MMIPSQIATSLSYPAVVGTVHSAASLAAARRLRKGQCDWLELRLDSFFPKLDPLRRVGPRLPCPRIVTVRHSSEGGAPLTARERRAIYRDFIPMASLVDIELRRAPAMDDVIRRARDARAGIILSHHDFAHTPSPSKLRDLARRARDAGADIFKVAAMTHGARDLATLLEFLAHEKSRLPLSVMGMGPFGKVSRLALAQAGSCLNYGYLGSPNAPGQWPAALLKSRIAEL